MTKPHKLLGIRVEVPPQPHRRFPGPPEYRAVCFCGWTEKAQTRRAAEDRFSTHVELAKERDM